MSANNSYPPAGEAPPQQQQPPVSLENAPPSNAVELQVIVGPLINYRRMSQELTETPIWHGSVLIVTNPGQSQPDLLLRCVGAVEAQAGAGNPPPGRTFQSEKLYEDSHKAFWRFSIDVPIQDFEANWEYSITKTSSVAPKVFTVPSKTQSMRIMFHSCNGFSIGTDEDAWSGPALWNDVLRNHNTKPFHVMIGGGDQIYNDNVRVTGPLKEWTEIANPRKRQHYPFGEDLRLKSDQHYFDNYVRWYGMEPFKSANSTIPQVNIWDDHDIIDGFGSYTDHFMRCHVFRGIGGVAHKYYMLFQHHLAPPKSTFTSDAPVTAHEGSVDPVQQQNTFVLAETTDDPAYIVGQKPGPYVEERSRSIYCQLGARVGFAGIDARTERTRHQVNYPETYKLIFERLDREYSGNPNLKHLILLLGVPIAYPRLQWLENIFSSPIIAPIRFLNKRFGFAGGLFNKFDGQVDLLDDLDDHYTARNHKHERRDLIERLQAFSKLHSVRVTILGGDVHLGAIGRFFSKPALDIPAESDWRYMPNIISSAITNKPPPQAVANLLARRNKIHHLNHETDETLLELFDHDPGLTASAVQGQKDNGTDVPAKKTMASNHCTMPSRNYAIIAESSTSSSPPAAQAQATSDNATGGLGGGNDDIGNGINGDVVNSNGNGAVGANGNGVPTANGNGAAPAKPRSKKPNMRLPFHDGEKNAGTSHPAAGGFSQSGLGGECGLDVTLKVEISNKDREGKTEGYGFNIPGLDCKGYVGQGTTW